MKVATIVGTRPEIIKLSRVIHCLDQHTEHVLIHTGQNFDFELNQIFFKDLQIRKPNYFLETAKENPMETIAEILKQTDRVLRQEKPDAFLVYGDTNSCLSALAAKRLKIPIFHMEAGNRCFDQRVPEEINRKLIDHMADINMPLSEHARQYLIKEGLPSERIIKTGSCMKEVFHYYATQIEESPILTHLQVAPKEYFLASLHREENLDDEYNFNKLIESLYELASSTGKKVFVSTHPRTMRKVKDLPRFSDNSQVSFLKAFGFFDYVKLQKNASCVLSDSGTITEESSLLQFPAVTIRNSHERPEGMDAGTLIMTGTEVEDLTQAVRVAMELKPGKAIADYQVDLVSEQVLKIILSYTHYINRYIWRKKL